MPIYQPTILVAKLVAFEVGESEFSTPERPSIQLTGELENIVTPEDKGNRLFWLPVPRRLTARSTLGVWIAYVAQIDPRVDALNFSDKMGGIKQMINLLVGKWYVWESKDITYPGGTKERQVPVQIVRDKEQARELYDAVFGDDTDSEAVEESTTGFADEMLDAATRLWAITAESQGENGEKIFRTACQAQWPKLSDEEMDALIATIRQESV